MTLLTFTYVKERVEVLEHLKLKILYIQLQVIEHIL